MKKILITLFAGLGISVQAQYWQQSVDYTMDITMNVENHQYDGYQKVQYTNNSPDTLQKAYFHLYFNAFQPGSMMDVRSRTIKGSRPSRDRPYLRAWILMKLVFKKSVNSRKTGCR